MAFIVSAILITVYVNLVVAQSSTTCNGDTYSNVYNFVNGVANCSFPHYKITSDIVRDGCPQLTTESLCPFNADKSLNKINIEKTVEIVQNCLKQPTIGNIELNRIKFPTASYSANEILQGFGLTGECDVSQHTSFFDNINNTFITVTDVQDNVNISIVLRNLIAQGLTNCKFTLPFVKAPIKMDNVSFYGILAYTSKSSISLKDNNSVPEIESPTVTLKLQFGFLQLPILNGIPLGSIFSTFFNEIMGKTKMSEIFANFIAAFVNEALKITKTQCK
ncbi:hypothetical protein CHUAL_006702 [Chamberlinius hualienensis]